MYDWKITAKKFGVSLVQVLIAGLISWATENPMYMGLVPVLEGLRNYWKNRNN